MNPNFSLDSNLRERVLAAAERTPAPTRPQQQARTRLAYGVALAAGLGVFELSGGAAHGAGRPVNLTIVIALGGLLVAVVAAVVAMRRGPSMLGRSRWAYTAVAGGLPVITFAWLSSFYGRYDEPFERVGWRCLGLTLTIAAAALAASLYDGRKSAVRNANWRGAAMGAASAAWASLLVDLWCPLTNAAHVLFGHVVPIVLVIAVGAVIGPRILTIRPVVRTDAG